MQLQIPNNRRYWTDAVQAYLLFEVSQKNKMIFDIWIYLFPLSIHVHNYLMNHKHELHLLRDPSQILSNDFYRLK